MKNNHELPVWAGTVIFFSVVGGVFYFLYATGHKMK